MKFDTDFEGIHLIFESSPELFSPARTDRGTELMLLNTKITEGAKALDLGCGYGFAGIWLALSFNCRIFFSDVNEKAVECVLKNCILNNVTPLGSAVGAGFENIPETGFDAIFSNPPYHADFSIPKEFIEKGFNRLKLGGKMYMVTKRKTWYRNKLTTIFGGVKIVEAEGYYIFEAEKRGMSYAKKPPNKSRR